MIPLRLSLTNFLSYRETAELDFAGLHLACISGRNGAGKSSILDSMTWALFGQSRSRSDDDVVNRIAARNGDTAEVVLDFALETVTYRIIRRKKVKRAMTVELQLAVDESLENWKALTGSTRRETDETIVDLLSMNYETFANASFLLQGQADAFTTKTAGKRKEILADLLGVSIWESYKAAAAERRKLQETQLTVLDAQLGEIELELAEEPARLQALETARAEYKVVAQQLAVQEQLLTQARRADEAIQRQKEQLVQSKENLAREEQRLARWRADHQRQTAERQTLTELLDRSEEITTRFTTFEAVQTAVDQFQLQANQYSEIKQAMQPHELAIAQEKSRLTERFKTLEAQLRQVEKLDIERGHIHDERKKAEIRFTEIAIQLADLAKISEQIKQLQEEKISRESEQKVLEEEMDNLRDRIRRLRNSTEGSCPLCGQPLTESHREEVIAELIDDGKGRRERYEEHKTRLPAAVAEIKRFEDSVKGQRPLEQEERAIQTQMTRLESRLEEIDRVERTWQENGVEEIQIVQKTLDSGEILPEAAAQLNELQQQLNAIGYKSADHQQAVAQRDQLRPAVAEKQRLDKAQVEAEALDKAAASMAAQIADQEVVAAESRSQYEAAAAALQALTADGATDLITLEREINALREKEIAANRRVGRAEQDLAILDTQQDRKLKLSKERAGITHSIQRLRLLEKACGRDGVQALLIEQALPEIEDAANLLLERLTDGQMQVRFETQRQLKSRDATAETLDIHIADNAGTRPYENFSGGEQFRVNFAIRIALSQILAKRAGARLRTLVIDEGFGSQDPTGRQRLIEAINIIQHDFKRILIITHIDELRDAFPNRIDVIKTTRGSQIQVT
ncbi:MAG: SMC family ATPase [Ardenticatenaceae bacterium]|nr:SMC family ATPase [Ardenticatenaceae bacterium]